MKKLLSFALMALAVYALIRWILTIFGGSGSGGGFFDGGNQQLAQVGKDIGDWLFYQTHPGPQRNNPVTGNPIPDATIYPGEPGGWMNA